MHTNANVSGQHRRRYRDVAVLLGALGDIKISMGQMSARGELRSEYKKKFPRHSSFQGELNEYLG